MTGEELEAGRTLELAQIAPRSSVRHAHPGDRLT
jgi:hypothetical protein